MRLPLDIRAVQPRVDLCQFAGGGELLDCLAQKTVRFIPGRPLGDDEDILKIPQMFPMDIGQFELAQHQVGFLLCPDEGVNAAAG